MAQKITILQVPDCPNTSLLRRRLDDALRHLPGSAPRMTVEVVRDADEARQRGFHGSPTLLVDGVDLFADPDTPAGFACRTYRTGNGIEGSPSVDQLVTALSTR